MTAVDDIFNEYMSLRENGLDVPTTLNTLNSFISTLSKVQKQELAAMFKGWEQNVERGEDDLDLIDSYTQTERDTQSSVTEWVACITCGNKNRKTAIFCHRCGTILAGGIDEEDMSDTHFFMERVEIHDVFFGQDSVLVLRVPETDIEYEVRPQNAKDRIYVGRMDSTNTIVPDIDLATAGGGGLGVSRLHLSIKHVLGDNVLQLFDLGSVNGTYLNGQRVHPKEVRVLRHGDELRLGRLHLDVNFHHPGDEV